MRTKNIFRHTSILLIFLLSLSLILTGFTTSETQTPTPKNLEVYYIDVGQGDSIFIISPTGKTILIDGGEKDSGVTDFLESKKIKTIDVVIATHPHSDHIGGLVDVIKNYDVKSVYMPKATHTTTIFENLILAIKEKGLKINPVYEGVTLPFEDINAVFVAPEKDIKNDNLNEYSAVLKLTYKDTSFLFTGDAESGSEQRMLFSKQDIKDDVLKAGRHGSKYSTSTTFLDEVNPKYVIISCGAGNKYGYPHDETIKKLTDRKIKTYRTDKDGTIHAISDGKTIKFETIKSDKKTDATVNSAETTTTLGNNTKSEDKKEEVVYITKSGKKYHRAGCRYLKSSQIKISKEEAIKKGYTPCSVCNPSKSEVTILKLIVDRFEGNYAVCEKEDGTITNLGKDRLPKGVKEGDVLILEGESIVIDNNATLERKKYIEELMEDMWDK